MAFFSSLFKDDRKKQIDALCAALPSLKRNSANKNNMILPLDCPNGRFSSLHITILDSFPQSAPVISAMGPIRHPWIDQYRFVKGCALLNNWNENSSLINVVLDIKRALEAGFQPLGEQSADVAIPVSGPNTVNIPGTAAGLVDKAKAATSNSSFSGVGSTTTVKAPANATAQPPKSSRATQQTQDFFVPPSSFPKLKELTQEQLARLLQDSVAFDAFKKELMTPKSKEGEMASSSSKPGSNSLGNSSSKPNGATPSDAAASAESMRQLRDTIRHRTVEIARANLAKDPEFSALQNEVTTLQKQLDAACKDYTKRLHALNKEAVSEGEVLEALEMKVRHGLLVLHCHR